MYPRLSLALGLVLALATPAHPGSTIIGWLAEGQYGSNNGAVYSPMATCSFGAQIAEALNQTQFRDSVTLSNLTTYVTTNTRASNQDLHIRVGGVNGSSVTITAGAADQFFTEAVTTDAIVADNLVVHGKTTWSGAGSALVHSTTAQMTTAGNRTVYLLGSAGGINVSAAAALSYLPINGQLAGNVTATITDVEYKIRAPGFAYGFQVAHEATTANFDNVLTLYRNGVATALTCTITAGTGSCIDTTNTVRIASGDMLAVGTDTGAGSATIDISRTGLFIRSDTNAADIGNFGGEVYNTGTPFTNYIGIIGNGNIYDTTEANKRIKIPFATTVGRFRVFGTQGTHNVTYTLRVNSADSALTVPLVAGSALDWYETSPTASVTLAAGDTLSVELDAPAGSVGSVFGVGLTLNYNPSPTGSTSDVFVVQ